jgi:hypothetical protein
MLYGPALVAVWAVIHRAVSHVSHSRSEHPRDSMPDPRMGVAPAHVDFGRQPVGSRTVRTVAITNKGKMSVAPYVSVLGDCFAFGPPPEPEVLIKGRGQTRVAVAFNPTSAGSCSGVLRVAASRPRTTELSRKLLEVNVPLRGRGVSKR